MGEYWLKWSQYEPDCRVSQGCLVLILAWPRPCHLLSCSVPHSPHYGYQYITLQITHYRHPPSDACDRLKDGLTALTYVEVSDREEATDMEEVINSHYM